MSPPSVMWLPPPVPLWVPSTSNDSGRQAGLARLVVQGLQLIPLFGEAGRGRDVDLNDTGSGVIDIDCSRASDGGP